MDTEARVRALAKKCGVRVRLLYKGSVYNERICFYVKDKDYGGPLKAFTWNGALLAIRAYAKANNIEEDSPAVE